MSGFAQWEVHSKTDQFIDVFKKEDVVFLAAESPNTITGMYNKLAVLLIASLFIELDQSKVYVIGGLVDHNYHKVSSY